MESDDPNRLLISNCLLEIKSLFGSRKPALQSSEEVSEVFDAITGESFFGINMRLNMMLMSDEELDVLRSLADSVNGLERKRNEMVLKRIQFTIAGNTEIHFGDPTADLTICGCDSLGGTCVSSTIVDLVVTCQTCLDLVVGVRSCV